MKKQVVLLLSLFLIFGFKSTAESEITVTAGKNSVSGKVVFEGKRPKSKFKTINKDTDICGTGKREYKITHIGSDGSVAKAVVFIEGKVKGGKPWPKRKGPYLMVQEECKFKISPEIYVVQKGAKWRISNNDPVAHNIHSYEMAGRARITMFNKQQPADSVLNETVRIRRPKSHGIKLECDQHNFMHEYMFAADNPYYYVTEADGTFKIEDIPPGKYTLVVWHPVLGEKKASIEIKQGKSVSQSFTFKK